MKKRTCAICKHSAKEITAKPCKTCDLGEYDEFQLSIWRWIVTLFKAWFAK
jgi:hypothetical protein